jgi:hypothetical protein
VTRTGNVRVRPTLCHPCLRRRLQCYPFPLYPPRVRTLLFPLVQYRLMCHTSSIRSESDLGARLGARGSSLAARDPGPSGGSLLNSPKSQGFRDTLLHRQTNEVDCSQCSAIKSEEDCIRCDAVWFGFVGICHNCPSN